MDRDTAKTLLAACSEALSSLTAAEEAIRQIEAPDERSELMRSLGDVIGTLLAEVRAPAVRQHPDLVPREQPGEPDVLLDSEEQEIVAALRSDQVARIDAALLLESSTQWRKVARVIGAAMNTLEGELPDVPVGYLAQRVIALVTAGQLQAQGNLEHIRFSEVRRP